MTVRESPDAHAHADDTTLLAAALDHTWAWYDGRRKRAVEVINYYLVATAILLTAYTSAINGKHYGFAAAIAATGLVLTALALAAAVRETRTAALAVPALKELQRRFADRLSIDSISMFKPSSARLLGQGRFVVLVALGLATVLNAGALIYALVHL